MNNTFLRKDISYLYNKLAALNSIVEQLIFLEQEKNVVERLFDCMNDKRITFFRYVSSRNNLLRRVNCYEVFQISAFLNKVVRTANLRYRNSYGAFSFIYRNRVSNYVMYRKYYNYFIKLHSDYIKLIEKEILFCNEKLRLGAHFPEKEKYLDYARRISKAKNGKTSGEIKRIDDNLIDLTKEEFTLYSSGENKCEEFKVLFTSPKTLDKELDKVKNDMGKIILLLELKKNIKKVLLEFADINRSTLDLLRLKKEDLLCDAPGALYFLEFQIDKHTRQNEKARLTVDHLYEHVKKKMLELEKLNTIVKNEIKYLDKKRVMIQKLDVGELNGKYGESEKIKNLPNIDSAKVNINKEVDNRKVWKGTKGEFAIFVNEQYLGNQDKYSSLREATNYLFEKYRFKWGGWTKEMCYDYVKKM